MPELPEVETVVREIRPAIVGRSIEGLTTSKHDLRKRWSRKWANLVIGRRVVGVVRRGKWILVDLDGPWLVIHLGMTGQLRVVPAHSEMPTHCHMVFALDDGNEQLRFRDVRRFGSVTLYRDQGEIEAFFEKSGLGPEPFGVDAAYWHGCLERTNRCLKAVLLDQRVLAGVGNIYADESLFEAKLHPTRLGRSLIRREAERLRKAVATVLQRAIKKRGATIRDFVGGNGEKGGFQREFRVYGRTGEPCFRCRTPITRIVLAGRSTHFCPECQAKEMSVKRVRSER